MDDELISGLVVLIGIIAFAWKILERRRTSDNTDTPPGVVASPERKPSPTLTDPFDTTTARPSQPEHSICGAARIIDGDTVVIQKTQIRVFGIDAPELNHPYGQKAKWALVKLCKGQAVRAQIVEVDHFGRTVAKCSLADGRDLSAEMVKLGLAIDWPKFSGGRYRHLEVPGARRKMWLADARQNGRMHVWEKFEAQAK